MHTIQKKYYEKIFSAAHYQGILGVFTRGYHRKLENFPRKFRRSKFAEVVEIGAGNGEHLNYVNHEFDCYTLTDIVEHASPENSKTKFVCCSANSLPFADNSFDRLIASCVILHVHNADKALLEFRRVLKNDGVLSLYVPCDPGILYRLIRHFFSHMKQSKLSQVSLKEIKFLWALEHPNHVLGIKFLISTIYKSDVIKLKRFPFPHLSWNLNLYFIYQIKITK